MAVTEWFIAMRKRYEKRDTHIKFEIRGQS
jgi:hypothetical protein